MNVSTRIIAVLALAVTGGPASAQLATDVKCTGCVGPTDIAAGSVTSSKIADEAVRAADLAADAVTNAKIANAAVGTAELAGNAVTSSRILNGTVRSEDLANGAVTGSKIATGAVGLAQLDPALGELIAKIEDLERDLQGVATNTVLQLGGYLTLTTDPQGNPVALFTAVNVQIVDGSGGTYNGPYGLGNLIVGYNEAQGTAVACSNGVYKTQPACEGAGYTWAANHRSGSHNVVVGANHSYSQVGSLVTGYSHVVNANGAAAVGGYQNIATGNSASVIGGLQNVASGDYAVVGGGYSNVASGNLSSVSGGHSNSATGWYSTVSGGEANSATDFYSTVSGGQSRTASDTHDWRAGGLLQDN